MDESESVTASTSAKTDMTGTLNENEAEDIENGSSNLSVSATMPINEAEDIESESDNSSMSATFTKPIGVIGTINEKGVGETSKLDGIIADSIQESARKFYSSTSSVFAEHTISNPNCEQILFCMSTVLQAQIFEDLNAADEFKGQYPEFDVTPTTLPFDLKSSEMLLRESENDKELSQQLLAGNVPTLDTIYSYIRLLKERSGYPTECNIIALIYTNRITSMSSLPLTMQNWRAVWIVAVILAQKMWDDTPLKTSAFVQILPYFSKQLLRNLELKYLTILQFSYRSKTIFICSILL